MKIKCSRIILTAFVQLFLLLNPASSQECTEGFYPEQSDELFPPAKSAEKEINFDNRGFIIHGKRIFLNSGSIHYPRVPRENWRDILLKLKRSGFNTVETYIFWNYHEAKEGVYDFTTENRDFGAFLDLARDLGLYAIVRVGPYICGEWENGGFPNWLCSKSGLEVRKDNDQYLQSVGKWFNRMLPIIAKRQIHKGGNVILVQLENEMPTKRWKYWGINSDGKHMDYLLHLAHQNGIEIPMFFSGLHHAFNPAPDKTIDIEKRKSPWLTTELWTTWFSNYGCNDDCTTKAERAPWRVLAQGGSGFNLYMFHGGTTFGFYNFNNDYKFGDNAEKGMTCYDYGTLIGQTGEIRNLYLRLKRLAYQAETFSPILANSIIDTTSYHNFAEGIPFTVRTSPEGSLVFLNNKNNDTTVLLKNGTSVRLAKKEIAAFVMNYDLANNLKILESSSRILGILKQKEITTIICFGEKGNQSKIIFSSNKPIIEKGINDCHLELDDAKNTVLSFEFPQHGIAESILSFGKTKIRILAINKETADKTWFADDPKWGRQVIFEAPYLGEFKMESSGKIYAEIDCPLNYVFPDHITVLANGKMNSFKISPLFTKPEKISLGPWKMYANIPQTDSSWFSLPDGSTPELAMNGNNTPYGWYHTSFTNDSTIVSLIFKRIGDRAAFFLDGKPVANYNFKDNQIPHIPVTIPAGKHELSVFTAHAGRSKFAGFVGNMNALKYQKGLRGPVYAELDHSFMTIGNWKMSGGIKLPDNGLKWSNVSNTKGLPAFFKTQIVWKDVPQSGTVYRFVTKGLSFGNVWFNGHNIGRYPEIVKDCPGIWIPSCWIKKGENTLVIFDENGNNPGKVEVIIEEEVSRSRIVLNSCLTE